MSAHASAERRKCIGMKLQGSTGGTPPRTPSILVDRALVRDSFTSIYAPLASYWRHRQLVSKLVMRDLASRYRGSYGDMLWAIAQPIAMLAVYTFVFSNVLQSRWSTPTGSENAEFVVILFVGLIVHGLFAECVLRALNLIVSNNSFVKKVVFPLEILPMVVLGSALYVLCINLALLLAAMLVMGQALHITMIWAPLIFAPLIFLTIGSTWLLASLGVFLRDIGQIIGLAVTAMLFLAPILYPITAVQPNYRMLLYINPLTFPVEEARKVLLWGHSPDFQGLILYSLASYIAALLGFAFFQRTRGGFADVI